MPVQLLLTTRWERGVSWIWKDFQAAYQIPHGWEPSFSICWLTPEDRELILILVNDSHVGVNVMFVCETQDHGPNLAVHSLTTAAEKHLRALVCRRFLQSSTHHCNR